MAMDTRKFQFLKAVLGEDGAKALAKAAERGPELEAALLPRTIMAWLGIYSNSDFEGQIPGIENTYLQFAKAEDRFSGSVAIGDEVYSFEKATMLHLGACVAVALGADHERVSTGLRDLDIQRLGKNIDTLAKARIAIEQLRKSYEPLSVADSQQRSQIFASIPKTPAPGTGLSATTPAGPKAIASAPVAPKPAFTARPPSSAPGMSVADTGKRQSILAAAPRIPGRMTKTALPHGGQEAPGPAHAPTPPGAPIPAQAPDPTQNSKGPVVGLRPKLPKLPQPKASTDVVQTGTQAKAPKSKPATLKVSKSQAEVACPVCGGTQFKADRFHGCICFRALSKSVAVTVVEDGYNLEFRADWDQDSILTLIESLGKK